MSKIIIIMMIIIIMIIIIWHGMLGIQVSQIDGRSKKDKDLG